MIKMFFVVAVCFFSAQAWSQHLLSAGPEVAFGTNFGKTKAGFGASIEYLYKFSERVGVRTSGGYDVFNVRNVNDSKTSFLPIRVGIEGFLSDVFFAYCEAGIAFYRSSFYDENKFSYAIGTGYKVPFGLKNQFVQISALYNSVLFTKSSLAWFNFRVAYGIDLGPKSSKAK
jgi:hypothetical protein